MRKLLTTCAAVAGAVLFATPAYAAGNSISVDPTGDADLGRATISGVATCAPGAFGQVNARIVQGSALGASVTPVVCDNAPHSWAMTVPGAFTPGAAKVYAVLNAASGQAVTSPWPVVVTLT
jgi:hypothetical protein